jgi:2-(1,2-epoxy-1,2-dihydrophenyl)acetyl-CoA isomerase
MDNKAVLWRMDENVCVITMNVPESMNAMNLSICEGLGEAFDECFNENIRAVVLTGAGRAFCAGGNITQSKGDYKQWLFKNPKKISVVLSAMRELPKPVIASINGPAFGAGMSLAMACDLRIASEKAVMGQAYTSVGLCPDMAWSITVPQIVGMAKALEMAFLDKPIKAEEALQLGLVTKVVPAETLEDEAMKMAKTLANGPTKAYASAKALINNSMLATLECQMVKENSALWSLAGTEDFLEGCDAILHKRKPFFKGK